MGGGRPSRTSRTIGLNAFVSSLTRELQISDGIAAVVGGTVHAGFYEGTVWTSEVP